jgi:hypothetical protein
MKRSTGMYASPVVLPPPSTASSVTTSPSVPSRSRATHAPVRRGQCPTRTDDLFKIIGRGGRVHLQMLVTRSRRPLMAAGGQG